jgi:hypothetical protein
VVRVTRTNINPEQLAAARKLVGKQVRASFMAKRPPMTVQSVSQQGMITVDGLRGEFAPDWFWEINPK